MSKPTPPTTTVPTVLPSQSAKAPAGVAQELVPQPQARYMWDRNNLNRVLLVYFYRDHEGILLATNYSDADIFASPLNDGPSSAYFEGRDPQSRR